MSLLCSNCVCQESITGGEFTLTFHFHILTVWELKVCLVKTLEKKQLAAASRLTLDNGVNHHQNCNVSKFPQQMMLPQTICLAFMLLHTNCAHGIIPTLLMCSWLLQEINFKSKKVTHSTHSVSFFSRILCVVNLFEADLTVLSSSLLPYRLYISTIHKSNTS